MLKKRKQSDSVVVKKSNKKILGSPT